MALMIGKLYAALVAAGVPDDKAREAAEEVAEFREQLFDIRTTQRVHTWILTFNTAMMIAVVGKLFLGGT